MQASYVLLRRREHAQCYSSDSNNDQWLWTAARMAFSFAKGQQKGMYMCCIASLALGHPNYLEIPVMHTYTT